MLSPVSTWMGDRLGTLGAVGIIFSTFEMEIALSQLKRERQYLVLETYIKT